MVPPSASQQPFAYTATDCSSSGSQHLHTGSETPSAAAADRRPSAALSSSSSWSRASATSTDQSFPSRTSSTAAFATNPPLPSSNRDSFISIVDDPFFQSLDSPNTPTAPTADTYKYLESESETLTEIPFFSPETPRSNRYDHEGQQKLHWPPPRRESLTIGSSPFWVRFCAEMRYQEGEEEDQEEEDAKKTKREKAKPALYLANSTTQLECHDAHLLLLHRIQTDQFSASADRLTLLVYTISHPATPSPPNYSFINPCLDLCRGAASQGFTSLHLGCIDETFCFETAPMLTVTASSSRSKPPPWRATTSPSLAPWASASRPLCNEFWAYRARRYLPRPAFASSLIPRLT